MCVRDDYAWIYKVYVIQKIIRESEDDRSLIS